MTDASGRAAQLEALREQARGCRACPLWEINTRTVFGEGPVDAALMFVGEAPGEQEDRTGRPFVGAAGRMLDQALAQAGIDRASVYVTNVVKHRPWVPSYGAEASSAPRASRPVRRPPSGRRHGASPAGRGPG